MTPRSSRPLLALAVALSAIGTTNLARAGDDGAAAHERLRLVRDDSLAARREIHLSVLTAGIVSVAGGALMAIPDDYDHGIRVAGINTAVFGAVNTVVGAIALAGIDRERRIWEEGLVVETRADRLRYREHALIDESREAWSHALNLGLAGGYAALGGLALVVSRSDVPHPNRWLGTGIAVLAQSAHLVVVDLTGTLLARGFQARMRQVAPVVLYDPATGETQATLSLRRAF